MAVNVETGMREIGEIIRGTVEKTPWGDYSRAFTEGDLPDSAIEWASGAERLRAVLARLKEMPTA